MNKIRDDDDDNGAKKSELLFLFAALLLLEGAADVKFSYNFCCCCNAMADLKAPNDASERERSIKYRNFSYPTQKYTQIHLFAGA